LAPAPWPSLMAICVTQNAFMERRLAPLRSLVYHIVIDSEVLTRSETLESKSKRSHSTSCHVHMAHASEAVDIVKRAEQSPRRHSGTDLDFVTRDSFFPSSSNGEAITLRSFGRTGPEVEDCESEQETETEDHFADCTVFPESNAEDESEGITLMIRNLPSLLTQAQLTDALDKLGLQDQIRLLYLPFNFRNSTRASNKGFAFIHMSSHKAAEILINEWHGKFVLGRVRGRRALNIAPAHTQGHKETLIRWLGSSTTHIHNPKFAPITK